MDKFPIGVAERLNWYVYRLIDPRNGETFYIGKGRGDRIFQHAKGALASSKDEDTNDLKNQRIKDIIATGLEVAHVIHRHNIESANIAFQIEAALIDAYPGLANRVSGHGSGDYGVRHVAEIITDYAASPFEVGEPLILISIAKSYEDQSLDIYDAVRACWRVDKSKVTRFKLVLAHRRGLVVGAYRPLKWLPYTKENFPWLEAMPGRYGFEGLPAEVSIKNLYVGRRVPDEYRIKGAANPIRFIEPPRSITHTTAPTHSRFTAEPEDISPVGKVTRIITSTMQEP